MGLRLPWVKAFAFVLLAIALALGCAPKSARAAVLEVDDNVVSGTDAVETPDVEALAHVQDLGWMGEWVAHGQTVGTIGRSLRLEALRLRLVGTGDVGGGIQCKAHVEDAGWQEWVDADGVVGGVGLARRIEAVKIRLFGEVSELYDLWYRAHVQGVGWMGWASNGDAAGSSGRALRIEALQVVIVAKGAASPACDDAATEVPFYDGACVSISAHVQDVGWQGPFAGGQAAGIIGHGLRLEALRATVAGADATGGITCRAHVQDVGWQDWRDDGQVVGTVGSGLRVEAIEMLLFGEVAEQYDLYYRVHVQNVGWMAWAAAGDSAGTVAFGLRVEAVQAVLLAKGGAAPDDSDCSTTRAFMDGNATVVSIGYVANVAGRGWQEQVRNGDVAGTTGQALPMVGLRVEVSTGETDLMGTVQCRAHVTDVGWRDWVGAGEDAAGGDGRRIEAVAFRLVGELASYYGVWYRAHVSGYGWTGWAANGEAVGSVGLSRGMEAVQVMLLPATSPAPGSVALPLLGVSVFELLGGASGTRVAVGFGGYTPSSLATALVNSAISRVVAAGSDIGFVLMDLVTGKGVSYNADTPFYAASSVKGPYVASLCAAHPWAIDSEMAAIRRVLSYSSNSDYLALRRRYGRACMDAWCAGAQVRTSVADLNYPYYSARELARLWGANYNYFGTAGGSRIAGWYQAPEVSPVRDAVAGRAVTRTKAGWIGEAGYSATCDAGIVYVGDRPYVVAIMTNAPVRFDLVTGMAAVLHDVHGEM